MQFTQFKVTKFIYLTVAKHPYCIQKLCDKRNLAILRRCWPVFFIYPDKQIEEIQKRKINVQKLQFKNRNSLNTLNYYANLNHLDVFRWHVKNKTFR